MYRMVIDFFAWLVSYFGKTTAKKILIIASKVTFSALVFTSFLGFFGLLFILYDLINDFFDFIFSSSSSGGGCTIILFWSVLEAIGIIDLIKSMAPIIFLVLSTISLLFLYILLARVYAFVDKSIYELTS